MSTFPSTPKPSTIQIRSMDQNRTSVTHSFKRIVTSRGGHRWMFTLNYPPMTREQVSDLWAFVVAQGGQAGSFDFTAPEHAARGSLAGTPLVDGADQTGTTLNLKGFTGSQTGVLKVGDYLRIAGDYKAYMIIEDVDSAADGTATATIHPALQAAPADDAAIAGTAVFRCGLVDNQQSVDISTASHYGLSLNLIEVLD